MWGDCNGASMKQAERLMDAGEGAGGMWGDCNGASMELLLRTALLPLFSL